VWKNVRMPENAQGCPSDETIAELVDGRLSQRMLESVERHIGACDSCRDAIAELAKLSRDESDAPSTGGNRADIHLPAVDPHQYAVRGEISRGGMGRILEAWDCFHQRPVAIKVLLRKSPEGASRFAREIAITAQLQHPAIVPLYAAGRWTDGEPFFAMKHVEGRSLAEVLGGAATMKQRLALLPHLAAVTDALAYAHERGVVHRDLKPSNVLVGAFGETVVIDWGLAKRLGASDEPPEAPPREDANEALATVAGHAIGTPSFMPPEQARGEAADQRADVYALGALLYSLLAGVPPHAAASAKETIAAVLAGPPEPLAARAPDAPPDLGTLVEKAMARDPADRYASAGDVAADLRRFMTGQLVSAHSYSSGVLLRRWAWRHKAALSITAAFLVIVAGVSAFAARGVVRERDRADAAKAAAEEQRRAAVQQRDAGERLVGFVIDTLRTRLQALGRLDLLRDVGREVDDYYEKASSQEDTDAAALVRRAKALGELGSVEMFDRERSGVAPLFASARRLLLRALEIRPGELEAELTLVHVEVLDAGNAMDTERYDDALASARRAVEIGQRAVREHPADSRARRALADGELREALVLRARDPRADVGALYADACATLERARDAAPDDAKIQRSIGWAYFERAYAARARGEWAEAERLYLRSIEARERLVALEPGPARERELATARFFLAEVKLLQGRFDEGLADYGQIVAAREAAVKEDPTNPSSLNELAQLRQSACVWELRVGRRDEALADCARARQLVESPATKAADDDVVDAFVALGEVTLEAGRARAARAPIDRADAIASKMFEAHEEGGDERIPWTGWLVARQRLAEGDVQGARSRAERAVVWAESERAAHPDAAPTWVGRALGYTSRGDVAVARGDRAGALAAYRVAHEAFVRVEGFGKDPIEDPVRRAESALRVAKLVARDPGGRDEARALADEAIAALAPLEEARHLLPAGALALRDARALR
jgi:tetratricopeptide (TPR) repeat protein